MTARFKYITWTALLCCGLFSVTLSSSVFAGVVVNDLVAIKAEKVFLSAQTRGRIFAKGGEIVEFFIDGKTLGKTLSGGDGFAYKSFTPAQARAYKIQAVFKAEQDTGILLTLEKETRIVFIHVEGSLLETFYSIKPKKGAQEAVAKIAEQFPIVFLKTGFWGVKLIKIWLNKHNFDVWPVLPWRQGAIFNNMTAKGLKVHAVIGGPKVISVAAKLNPLAFSFEPTEYGEEVDDWGEIVSKLINVPAIPLGDSFLKKICR